MKVLNFMTQETDAEKKRILLLAAISGITNSFLLVLLNHAATQLENGSIEAQLLFQYIITFVLFIFAQRSSQRESVTAVETALQRVRVRIANKVRRSELRTIEELGNIGTYSSLTQGASTVAQAVMYLVKGIESLFVLIFASLYLLWLSPVSFLMASILIGLAIPLLIRHYHRTFSELSEASQKEGIFFENFTAMLKGFKHLKINQRESEAMFSNINQLATETGVLKSRSNVRLLEDVLLSNVTFYLLLLLVVFILPNFIPAHEENLFQVITTILFMIGPISAVAAALPNVSKTNVAISNLYKLEERLDKNLSEEKESKAVEPFDAFNTITLKNVCFTYTNTEGEPLFDAGPFTLSCKRGEILFITGGNGSGKSTFLKLLTGLYYPRQGHIYIDQRQIPTQDYPVYRELFSVVFSDFQLFDHLYGQTDASKIEIQQEINAWLEKLDLSHITHFEDGRFTNTDLSTGQRKRLALIIALIQHRPILVFDELAADQDPKFRKLFYEDILPELKQQGKTIISVTHDDKYFGVADQVLSMNNGQLDREAFR
ncbi:MAG: Unknown protein [uncultured Thiotrichaceae bacterium]|uniref:Cyclic peptide transporter n=1 Tax=uncultured Thiotrichaceae bacterium TaxID=298394 RepID=A0A6S6U5P8_9GAMM|nr:MAG: Unknown protein [uncultured Thiotrichaceae bacterium]